MRKAIAIAALAVGLLGTCDVAAAGWPHRVERAQKVAVAYWAALAERYDVPVGEAICGTVTTRKQRKTHGHAMVAYFPTCTVAVQRRWWRESAGTRYGWPSFCTIYVHEWGHLFAQPHSDDPASVMSPTPTTIDECQPKGEGDG